MATINMLEETANYLLNHCFVLGSVEDQRAPSVAFAAELFGRHSHAAFEILAEERRIGEIEFVGDLLNGELVIGFEQIFRVHDDRVVDPPRRAVARYGPYYRREVISANSIVLLWLRRRWISRSRT